MYEGEVVGRRYICMKERKVHMYEGEVVGIYVEGIYV